MKFSEEKETKLGYTHGSKRSETKESTIFLFCVMYIPIWMPDMLILVKEFTEE